MKMLLLEERAQLDLGMKAHLDPGNNARGYVHPGWVQVDPGLKTRA